MTDLPIACTLTAAELKQRRGGLLPGLLARALERHPVSLEVTGPPGTREFLDQLMAGAAA